MPHLGRFSCYRRLFSRITRTFWLRSDSFRFNPRRSLNDTLQIIILRFGATFFRICLDVWMKYLVFEIFVNARPTVTLIVIPPVTGKGFFLQWPCYGLPSGARQEECNPLRSKKCSFCNFLAHFERSEREPFPFKGRKTQPPINYGVTRGQIPNL